MSDSLILIIGGYLGYIFKAVPDFIIDFFDECIASVIIAESNHSWFYEKTLDWIDCYLKPIYFGNHVEFMYRDSFENKGTSGIGSYYFYTKDYCIGYISFKRIEKQGSYTVHYHLTIKMYGLNASTYFKKYNDYINNSLSERNVLSIHVGEKELWQYPRKFDSVFYKDKQKIINILDWFVSSKDYFISHGLNYKLGFLFYGEPGTGKSTLIRAIASYLHWDIEYLNCISILQGTLPEAKNRIYVLEDFDRFFELGNFKFNDNNKNDSNVFLLPFDIILNLLDGTLTPRECIFIATCNSLDQLPEALLRPGRFDFVFNVGLFDFDMAKEVCDYYHVDYSFLDDFTFPVSPALIQSKIFSYFSKSANI